MYSIFFHQEARKHLKKFTPEYRNRIGKSLKTLSADPFKNSLNIKKLETNRGNYLRIRLGELRIIYELNSKDKIIIIRDIDFRGNVY